MAGFEVFRDALQEALTHLRDPDCQLSPLLYGATGCVPGAGSGPLQAEIMRSIEELRPAPDLPPSSRAWREYQILVHRFVLGLTVDEAADQLFLSRRTLQRVQREAQQTLAGRMWRAWRARESADEAVALNQATDWHAQAQQELASLETSALRTVTPVEPVVRDVLEMGPLLTQGSGVSLELGFVQPDLAVGIHPSALRQMLVTAVRRLAAQGGTSPITVYGVLEEGQARVTLTTLFDESSPPAETELVRDILLPEGASTEVILKEDTVFLSLRLPSSGALNVVVVDDNPDIVHFYRRCVAGTAYRIVHAASTNDLFEAIETMTPQAVVLDIMLPDVDGWKLLMRLYEDPATRSIPVVVCTVVREEELALSLGAAAYLAKPVDAQQFVATLNRVTRVG